MDGIEALQNRPTLLKRLGQRLQGLSGRNDPLAMLVIEAALGRTTGKALATRLLAVAPAMGRSVLLAGYALWVPLVGCEDKIKSCCTIDLHFAALAFSTCVGRCDSLGGAGSSSLCAILRVGRLFPRGDALKCVEHASLGRHWDGWRHDGRGSDVTAYPRYKVRLRLGAMCSSCEAKLVKKVNNKVT